MTFHSGQDSEKASVQYIIDGKQSMTVFKDTRTLAADSVAMAVDILDGKEDTVDELVTTLQKLMK